MVTSQFFAFPVNVIFLFSLLFILFIVKNVPLLHPIWKKISSSKWLFYALSLFLGTIFIIQIMRTFFPDSLSPQNIFFKIGLSRFLGSPFLAVISTCLLFTLMAHHVKQWALKFSWKHLRPRLFELGAILIIISLFWGTADQHKYTIVINKTYASDIAHTDTKCPVRLPFSIQLDNIDVTQYKSGNAKQVEAKFHITQNDKIYHTQCHVNGPASFHDYDLYLQSYHKKNEEMDHCVLMLVKDPWKKATKTGIIFLMIAALMMMIPVKSNVKKEGETTHD